jgi:hypothetical protein
MTKKSGVSSRSSMMQTEHTQSDIKALLDKAAKSLEERSAQIGLSQALFEGKSRTHRAQASAPLGSKLKQAAELRRRTRRASQVASEAPARPFRNTGSSPNS